MSKPNNVFDERAKSRKEAIAALKSEKTKTETSTKEVQTEKTEVKK